MTGSQISLFALAVSISLFGYPMLRKQTRRVMLLIDIVVHAALLFVVSERLVSTAAVIGIYVAVRAGALIAVMAASRRFEPVEPWRFAILAGAVYLSLIPHVSQWPMDGDEPYYVLVAHSLGTDFDLDLTNQYAASEALVGRRLGPQKGDPTGEEGELYSRHEPFLPLLMAPFVLASSQFGPIVFMSIIAALLTFSVGRLLEEEEVSVRSRMIALGFFSFGPAVIFFANRVWPELPATLCLVEALRSFRDRRHVRLSLFALPLALLKLRYLAIVAPLFLLYALRESRESAAHPTHRRRIWIFFAAALLVVLLPMAVLWLTTGDPTSVHTAESFKPGELRRYWLGLSGLVVDAQAGLIFQAPFLAVGLFGLLSRHVRESALLRVGLIALLPYVLLLLPRAEWHGGWSPPLRYVVVLTPLLLLAAARVIDPRRRLLFDLTAIAACVTAVIVAHGIGSPHRLFHIANGESVFGEWLSGATHADYSRLLPSAIRENTAVRVAVVLIVLAVLLVVIARRRGVRFSSYGSAPAIVLLALFLFLSAGRRPGAVVHFEDAHVQHSGGALFPEQWTSERFLYDGGWVVSPGARLTFRLRQGRATLRYHADALTVLDWNGKEIVLPPATGWHEVSFPHETSALVQLQCRLGAATLEHVETR